MKKLLFIFLLISPFAYAQNKGTIKTDTLVSTAIANRITHENIKRAVTIYLPPGYANSVKRYPVLYLLHGIGDDNMDFADDSTKRYTNIQDLMDLGIAFNGGIWSSYISNETS